MDLLQQKAWISDQGYPNPKVYLQNNCTNVDLSFLLYKFMYITSLYRMLYCFSRDLSDLNVTFPFDAVDWSPERGYPFNTPLDSLPRRSRGSGSHLGLSVVVDAELAEYFCSSENGKGFKVSNKGIYFNKKNQYIKE